MRGLLMVAVAAGIGLAAGSAQAAPQVWQGTAFVTAVTPTCTANGDAAIGDFYTIVYRPIIAPSQVDDEGLSFFGSRSALHLFSKSTTTTLRGSGTGSMITLGSHAQSGTSFTSSGAGVHYDLGITPATITVTTPTVGIAGTVGGFFDTGCTVSFTAVLLRRP